MKEKKSLDDLVARGRRRWDGQHNGTGKHLALVLLLSPLVGACAGDPEVTDFAVVVDTPSAALTAVHGTAPNDVWVVGAKDREGGVALHYSEEGWSRIPTGADADLWWVHAFAPDDVYVAGSDATILHFDGTAFERQATPGLGRHTVFGVWGISPDDIYAVGAEAGRNGFIWHFDGTDWSALALPEDLPEDENHDTPALLKVSGRSRDEVWVVGDRGVVLRGNAKDGFDLERTDDDVGRWFTVHATADDLVVVGGSGRGPAARWGLGASETPIDVPGSRLLQGAFVQRNGRYWMSGEDGVLFTGTGAEPEAVSLGAPFDGESLHAIWVDPQGGVWTVGGNVISGDLKAGRAFHLGPKIERYDEPPVGTTPDDECPEAQIDPHPEDSMARRWNDQLLNAVRRDIPRPTVHARNLYHHSVALWDIWAAFDDVARGVIVDVKLDNSDPEKVRKARDEAMAAASEHLLTARYRDAVGGQATLHCLTAFSNKLGIRPSSATTFGREVAEAVLDHFAEDGSAAEDDYEDPENYRPDNVLLVVDQPGTLTEKPLLWQQLVLARAVTQNGIDQGSGIRNPVGTHWGGVTPFALERPSPGEPYFSPEHPPSEYDQLLRDAIVRVIVKSSELDHKDGVLMNISPGAYGNNSLGTDDGQGHGQNPATGKPYEKNIVRRGDFTRILSEFWADGPKSETPPGHWNTLANDVADDPQHERRLFGQGEPLDRLSWDVHVYLALNGALHDAAIAAWELKRVHESARPITLIRYYGGLGQSSDPDGPSYHPDGLPLIDGVIEVITQESSAPGERHAHLSRYQGELALWSWRGEPGDRESEVGGVGWVRAIEWMPYQRRNFVTPAFPGYVSGHSTFSRAAAEVLSVLTGSDYFPGGLGSYRFEPGYLVFEYGPSEPVTLEWGTYYDAADQAGQSRLWGGIHITHDDFDGRRIGSTVGLAAVELARSYFEGSAD